MFLLLVDATEVVDDAYQQVYQYANDSDSKQHQIEGIIHLDVHEACDKERQCHESHDDGRYTVVAIHN